MNLSFFAWRFPGALPDLTEQTVEKRDAFVPEGLADGSPTPQGVRRDRSAWVDKIEGLRVRRSLRRRPGTECLELGQITTRPVGTV